MSNLLSRRPGAIAGTPSATLTGFRLDRRRLCSVALASLIVPAAAPLAGPAAAPRVVIRDGWVLLESDLQ